MPVLLICRPAGSILNLTIIVLLAGLLGACSDPSGPQLAPLSGGVNEPINVDIIHAPKVADVPPTPVAAANSALPRYTPVAGISGILSSEGSDTLAGLMTFWAERFRHYYPNLSFQVQAAGSASAPPALAEGTANFGAMSRPMKELERQAFEDQHGYPPTSIRVAIDALAVFVHADNPISHMSLAEIDGIFSTTRRCGHPETIRSWGQLGLPGIWRERPIQLYGRNAASGTYGYFKSVALCGGDFANTVNEQPGAGSVMQAVATSLNSIGYASLGTSTPGVKALGLKTDSGTIIQSNMRSVASGAYPLSRYLYLYVNKAPGIPMSRAEREFLLFILSREGQAAVENDGHVPLPGDLIETERAKLR